MSETRAINSSIKINQSDIQIGNYRRSNSFLRLILWFLLLRCIDSHFIVINRTLNHILCCCWEYRWCRSSNGFLECKNLIIFFSNISNFGWLVDGIQQYLLIIKNYVRSSPLFVWKWVVSVVHLIPKNQKNGNAGKRRFHFPLFSSLQAQFGTLLVYKCTFLQSKRTYPA